MTFLLRRMITKPHIAPTLTIVLMFVMVVGLQFLFVLLLFIYLLLFWGNVIQGLMDIQNTNCKPKLSMHHKLTVKRCKWWCVFSNPFNCYIICLISLHMFIYKDDEWYTLSQYILPNHNCHETGREVNVMRDRVMLGCAFLCRSNG